MKDKTKNFRFTPENKKINLDSFTPYMNEMKSNTYTQGKKLIFDCTNKKNYLACCTMSKFYVEHGMVVEKVLEINPFKRNK